MAKPRIFGGLPEGSEGAAAPGEIVCKEPGARQADAKSCDINTIMAGYDKGVMPVFNTHEALYADVSQVGDYRSALERVQLAEEMFLALPAKVRKRFEQDPAKFVEFALNKENEKELREMGLLNPAPVVTEPGQVEGSGPGAAAAAAAGA